jgi:hypothetical protein
MYDICTAFTIHTFIYDSCWVNYYRTSSGCTWYHLCSTVSSAGMGCSGGGGVAGFIGAVVAVPSEGKEGGSGGEGSDGSFIGGSGKACDSGAGHDGGEGGDASEVAREGENGAPTSGVAWPDRERGEVLPLRPNPTAVPPRCATSLSFLLVVRLQRGGEGGTGDMEIGCAAYTAVATRGSSVPGFWPQRR